MPMPHYADYGNFDEFQSVCIECGNTMSYLLDLNLNEHERESIRRLKPAANKDNR